MNKKWQQFSDSKFYQWWWAIFGNDGLNKGTRGSIMISENDGQNKFTYSATNQWQRWW